MTTLCPCSFNNHPFNLGNTVSALCAGQWSAYMRAHPVHPEIRGWRQQQLGKKGAPYV